MLCSSSGPSPGVCRTGESPCRHATPTTSADSQLPWAQWAQEGSLGSPGPKMQPQEEQLLLPAWLKIPWVSLAELHFLLLSGKAPRFHGDDLFP